MLGVLFSTPVWPIAPKHFYLTSQEPEFLHIRESCQGHDKKTYYAQPLRQPRFPRGWIFLWISSSIKFYIREWKEEFFTSFLFYTQTHRKKSLMRPFFFLFSFFLSALLWASYVLLGCDFYYCDEKMFTKIMTKKLDWEWDVKERCRVSFLKERERSRRGLFFFNILNNVLYFIGVAKENIWFFFCVGCCLCYMQYIDCFK